jgi:TolB protein
MAGNNQNVFRIDADGSNQTQLTVNGGDNYTPAASPDGCYVVFSSNLKGGFNIWQMNAEDGSELRQLTFSDGNFYPSYSADGRWVVYDNQTSAKTTVWKVSIEGGAPVQLTDKPSRMPVVSPDNQFIACRYYELGWGIAILPFAGGAPVKLLQIPIMDWQRIQWTADGRALTYINVADGVSNIWSYDLASGTRKQLTDFKSDQIFAYGWSADHKLLAVERGSRSSDVTLITNP